MKVQEFATLVIALIEDGTAARKASNRDLAIVEGILSVILDSVAAELRRRDAGSGQK
jgi:hypothetical protein